MRYPGEIAVRQLVIHVVDPHRDNIVVSERDVPLDGAQRLREYFSRHISNSLQDAVASAACFEVAGAHSAFGLCRAILSNAVDLVRGSGQLAEQLAEIIRRNRSISPGVLVACLYTDTAQPESRYLALLKMDPSQVFRHIVSHDRTTGQRYVQLAVQSDVLPTEREKLQKCAFIQPLEPRSTGYDMLLLDRQTRVPTEVPVARFFVEDFLGAKLALDPRVCTERLYKGAIGAYNELKAVLPIRESEALRQAIDSAIRQPSIDLDHWLDSLPVCVEHKLHIDQCLVNQNLPDRVFTVDRIFGRTLVRKRVFRGDHGLKVDLSADPDTFNQVIESVERIVDPGSLPYYRVVLRTDRWVEVLP